MTGIRHCVVACAATLALLACREIAAPAAAIDLTQPWQVAAPAAVGMDSALVERAAADAAAIPRFRSLLVARHGRLLLERYFAGADATSRFDVRSVTKSIVATLTGLALARGKVSGLEASVGQYFGAPDTLDNGDRAVTVRQLLTMTSGYQWDETTAADYNAWILSTNHIQYLFDRPQTAGGPPGPFTYNSAAVHLLGVLLQRATGTPLPDFATEALFAPIGVTSAMWEPLEAGVNGGSGLQLTGRDLLRVGQLVLQEGRSGERQVVPASWVSAMTTPRFTWREAVGEQGGVSYGYLWWVADGPPVAAVFAWGYGGQFVYVAPTLDLVAVATTDWQGISSDSAAQGLPVTVLNVIVQNVVAAATPAR
jgi:CubicO group peptidase (beta-lactamase class C family)